MSCNCKANEQIFKIQKSYGKKVNISWSEKTKFLLEEGVKMFLIILILIPFTPLVLLYVLIMSVTGYGRFNLNSLVKKLINREGDE